MCGSYDRTCPNGYVCDDVVGSCTTCAVGCSHHGAFLSQENCDRFCPDTPTARNTEWFDKDQMLVLCTHDEIRCPNGFVCDNAVRRCITCDDGCWNFAAYLPPYVCDTFCPSNSDTSLTYATVEAKPCDVNAFEIKEDTSDFLHIMMVVMLCLIVSVAFTACVAVRLCRQRQRTPSAHYESCNIETTTFSQSSFRSRNMPHSADSAEQVADPLSQAKPRAKRRTFSTLVMTSRRDMTLKLRD